VVKINKYGSASSCFIFVGINSKYFIFYSCYFQISLSMEKGCSREPYGHLLRLSIRIEIAACFSSFGIIIYILFY
jgi:hypothetical protein